MDLPKLFAVSCYEANRSGSPIITRGFLCYWCVRISSLFCYLIVLGAVVGVDAA